MRYIGGMRIRAFRGPLIAVHSMSGIGAAGAEELDGDDGNDDNGGGGGTNDSPPDAGIKDDDEFNPDMLWGDTPAVGPDGKPIKKDDSQTNNNGNEDPDPEQAALAADVKAKIEGLTIGEDLIPADWNPADGKQMRTLLQAVQQETARKTMQIMFAPIQAAMRRQDAYFQQQIKDQIAGGIGQDRARQMLETEIDIATDPRFKATIDHIFGQAMKKANNDSTKALDLTKRQLKAMNMKFGPRNQNSPAGGGGGAGGKILSGASALDMFRPLPAQQVQTKNRVAAK